MLKNCIFILCWMAFAFSGHAKETICLNMIVKNETKVIKRCLESVKPLIDYWVIVDTGSTDGTQQMIKDYMQGIPGELHETSWVNFEHNRNDALDKAKGKGNYLLIIDADEIFVLAPDFKLPQLDKDFYYILTKYCGTEYVRTQLIKNDPQLNWRWIGVVHETINSPNARTFATLEGIHDFVYTDGFCASDPLKYYNHAMIFEKEVEKNPSTRNVFYLAQSWKDAKHYDKALAAYQRRIEMGGWDEEVYWSMLQLAHLQNKLGMPPETVLASYYKAYHYRPSRSEPLYYIANYHREKGEYSQGYLVAKIGSNLPPSKDLLFVEKWVDDYGMKLEYSICAYWIGDYDKCRKLSNQILAKPNLHPGVKETVERNLEIANAQILKRDAQFFKGA